MQRTVDALAESPKMRSSQRRGTIVVVDDSHVCLRAASLMLERAGFTTIVLDSPIGFRATLRDRQPDLALVDVNMPALRGDHLVAIATRNGQEVTCPIVLFSDLPAAELDKLAKRCGASGFVRKGPDWVGIVKAIEGFLRHA
jgi:FixJ family two-component response regulator